MPWSSDGGVVRAGQSLPPVEAVTSLLSTVYTQCGDPWRLLMLRKHASLPSSLYGHCVTIFCPERKGEQRSF